MEWCCFVAFQCWLVVCLEYKWSSVAFVLVNSCLIGRIGMVEAGVEISVWWCVRFTLLSMFLLSCFLNGVLTEPVLLVYTLNINACVHS